LYVIVCCRFEQIISLDRGTFIDRSTSCNLVMRSLMEGESYNRSIEINDLTKNGVRTIHELSLLHIDQIRSKSPEPQTSNQW
jgi:hypothetical protein